MKSRLPGARDIDPGTPIGFTFNGKRLQGLAGDTVASALAANGVSVLSRSFKRHRPRGLFALGVEDTGGIVRAGSGALVEPNASAARLPIVENLEVRSQNHWPSLELDVLRTLDLVADLFPAGFYNKTFKWPDWRWYEWALRRTAGIGTAPSRPDPDAYAHRHATVDVLVCGGGPVGLAAALVEAKAGKRVLLVEQDATWGGSLRHSPTTLDGTASCIWLNDRIREIGNNPQVEALVQTTAVGLYDHNYALLAKKGGSVRETLIRVRAEEILLATGAVEQPLVFENNDRPGIMLLSAVEGLAARYGVVAGNNIVIAGNHDGIYASAAALSERGLNVSALLDARPEVDEAVMAPAQAAGIAVHRGRLPLNTKGRKRLREISISASGPAEGLSQLLKCDTLAMSGGYAPAAHLACHAKLPLEYHESIAAFAPRRLANIRPIGAAAGDFDLERTLGAIALSGREADGVNPFSTTMGPRIAQQGDKRNQWVDWLHDVTLADLELAVRENYRSVEHLKRYTTNGMAIDQGKTSNLNALTHLAALSEREIANVGTTTYRPPYAPLTLGTIAGGHRGEFYAPVQRSPLHDQQVKLGAAFERYGSWLRPAYYGRGDEQGRIHAEVKAVREGVGLFDGSPLGKLEVRGPDAAAFLQRIYLNNAENLKAGRVRYGLMLNENGTIIDDGVFARLAEDRFLVSTTSGNAVRIYNWMEEWLQCEWTDLNVAVTNATTAWANVTLAGPRARDLLDAFDTDIDLSREAFPHQSFRAGTLEGVPARVWRVSFSGELCFEVNVPLGYGPALWDAAMDKGEALGVKPYGVEALMVMRIEKGYLHIGSDTDGTTTPDDVGWGRIAARKAAHFIGKRSLIRPHNLRRDRHQFIGLAPEDGKLPLHSGSHLTAMGGDRSEGYVTSATFSPTLGRTIGLGLLRGGRGRLGERIEVVDAGKRQLASVVDPVHFDKTGERLHG